MILFKVVPEFRPMISNAQIFQYNSLAKYIKIKSHFSIL